MAVAAGTEVQLGSWTISEDLVDRYLDAVGNPQSICQTLSLAPPLALSAWALGSILDRLSLPPGAIHSRQEMETHRPVAFGETLLIKACLGEPAQRAGLTMLTATYSLSDPAGIPVLTGKSTVLTGTSGGGRDSAPRPSGTSDRAAVDSGSGTKGPDSLPAVGMTISQPQLDAYAQASGDHNPLHLDAGFAAATQFQGIIAHGMLTLACISQMMEVHLGRAWLESGALNVRFKGAAYAGDELESFGRVSRSSKIDGGPAVTCNVGVRNLGSGQDLITGSAKAKLAEAT